MLATKVVCPHCSKRLKTRKPLAVGKRVLCSGCGHSFPVQPDDSTPRPHTRASSPLPPRQTHAPLPEASRLSEADERLEPDDEPAPNRSGLLLAGVLGGLLLLVGTAIALVLAFADQKGPQEQTAAAPDTGPGTSPKPEAPGTPGSDPGPTPRADDESPLAPRRAKPDPILPRPPTGGLPSPLDPPPLADPPLEPGWLPPAEQAKVNKAIDKGVAYLKKVQLKTGTWQNGAHETGLAALPGLTLLECGVNPYDPAILKAAEYVRQRIPRLNQTYEIALAILFLDHLGDRRDHDLIRTLSLRLIAGQKDTGGWTYDCPILQPKEELDLLTVLDDLRPQSPLDLFVPGPDGRQPPKPITSTPDDKPPPQPIESKATDPPSDLFVPEPKGKADKAPVPKSKADDAVTKKPATKPKPPARRPGQLSASGRRAFLSLPANRKNIPALLPPARSHRLPDHDSGRATDNSNTQFAILGLLASGRHGVPTERALALIVTRFRTSQDLRTGGWNYPFRKGGHGGSSPSMTGAGLLGMAVGLGLASPTPGKAPRRDHVDNPIVQKGLKELGRHINVPEPINLYFMWSVERVAMLYNLKTIAKKDWYGWGAKILVAHQETDGHWKSGGYPGALPLADTCLALLFLKRANLAKDLSKKLEFFIEGKGTRDERK